MESILEIADLIIGKDYSDALGKLESAFANTETTDAHRDRLYFYRAVCYSELGHFENALKDLDACEDKMGKSAKWLYLYGLCQFNTDDFTNALINFKRADEANDLKDGGLKNNIQTWMSKTQLELGNPYVGNINEAIFMKNEVEIQHIQNTSAAEPEESKIQENVSSGDTQNISDLSPDWYQNNEYVFVSILKKKLKGECTVSLTNDNAEINFPSGENFAVHLANSIDAQNSTYTQTEKKVEIKLKKKEQGIVWSALSKEEISQKPKEFLPSYPTSHKNKKNWSEVDRNIEKEFIKDKPEGDEAMNDLLKQIYSGADEETRRAMIKSYQTSNGTVLSTNWGEVKEKDYEGKDYVAPPDHFEAKKPEL